MTAPEAPTLTAAQLAELKVHATAAALAYHDTTVPAADRVDLASSYLVHEDLRLVAADVLEAACLHAQAHPVVAEASAIKKIKVGPIELEKAVARTVPPEQVNAGAWCERAARLRREAGRRTGPLPSPLASMRAGGSNAPVFTITRPIESGT